MYGRRIRGLAVVIFLVVASYSMAHSEARDDGLMRFDFWSATAAGMAGLCVLVAVSIAHGKGMSKKTKKIMMALYVVVIAGVTLYMAVGTVYLNFVSETGGPVHWHMDYEVWKCGEKLELPSQQGLDNKLGTPLLHTHYDDRIHAEGVIVHLQDADLDTFFAVIGGDLTKMSMAYPTGKGLVTAANGELCNGAAGKLQAFVYMAAGNVYWQEKVDNFPSYVMSHNTNVPPGDCMIIEFGPEKNSSDKMCSSYRIAAEKGSIVKRGDVLGG